MSNEAFITKIVAFFILLVLSFASLYCYRERDNGDPFAIRMIMGTVYSTLSLAGISAFVGSVIALLS